jgi:hypothetical protein
MLSDTINELDVELQMADLPKSEDEVWHGRKDWPQLHKGTLRGFIERAATIAWRAQDEAWAEKFKRNSDAQKRLLVDAGVDQCKGWFQRALTKLSPHLALCEHISGLARHGDEYVRSSNRGAPGVANLDFEQAPISFTPTVGTSVWCCIIVDTEGSKHDAIEVLRGAHEFWRNFLQRY